jgi:aspartyl/asparaginyl-tRNA synthetase
MNIKQILSKEDQLIQQNELLKTNNINNQKEIKKIFGWVKTVRSSSNILAFCVINDGSNVSGMQIVLNNENMEENQIEYFLKNIQIGTFLNCSGYIIESPAEGQKYEISNRSMEAIEGFIPTEEEINQAIACLKTSNVLDGYHFKDSLRISDVVKRCRSYTG